MDVETNPGPRRPVPTVCRLLECSNVRSLAGNLSDLTVASSRYDILLCSETGLRYASRVRVAGSQIWSCCAGAGCLGPEGSRHTYEMDMEHFASPSLSVVPKCCFLGFVVRQNLYVFSLYRNPDLDDRIFDCSQTSISAVQAEDLLASFLFVADLNGHHQEWLGSTTTNRHGVAAFDFATVSGWDQLVVGLTHARGGTLNLLMTDVPDLVRFLLQHP